MNQTDREARRELAEVLEAELNVLRDHGANGQAPPPAANVREVYERIASEREPLSALCLSGGGVRSASFNLGVLEALAGAGVLGKFDYLSTVSGGGYIGAWLQAWIARARQRPTDAPVGASPGRSNPHAVRDVLEQLGPAAHHPQASVKALEDPLSPEPEPVRRLREYSNYLTPRKGLLSGDTWSVAAIVLRNLILN